MQLDDDLKSKSPSGFFYVEGRVTKKSIRFFQSRVKKSKKMMGP
jgi:hypothetical protein